MARISAVPSVCRRPLTVTPTIRSARIACGSRRQPMQQQRDHRNVEEAAEEERCRGTAVQDQRAAERWPNHPRYIDPHTVERNRRREFMARYEVGNDRLEHRHAESEKGSEQEGGNEDNPRGDQAEGGREREQQ